MNEFFKNLTKFVSSIDWLNVFMAFICILASVTFFVDNNIYAGIWAINTLQWVIISTINEATCNTQTEYCNHQLESMYDDYQRKLKSKNKEIERLTKEIENLKNQK